MKIKWNKIKVAKWYKMLTITEKPVEEASDGRKGDDNRRNNE